MDSVMNTINGLPDIAKMVIAIGATAGLVLFVAVIGQIFGPIGRGTGKAIGDVGESTKILSEGVAMGIDNVSSLFGVRDLLKGMAAAILQRAQNEEETIDVGVEFGDGRKFWVKGHGHRTSPVLAEKITDLPIAQIPAPNPDVVGLLVAPSKKGGRVKH